MKRKIIFLTVLFSLILSACNKPEIKTEGSAPLLFETTSQAETEPVIPKETDEAETTPEQADKPDITGAFPEGFVFYAPDGEPVYLEDMTDLYTDENGYWGLAQFDGFASISEPTGLSFNSIENPDRFEPDLYISDELAFSGEPIQSKAEYKRYYVGDSICGFKVISAMTQFVNMHEDFEIHDSDSYRPSCSAALEGSATMTGYFKVMSVHYFMPGYSYEKGDTYFIPDNSSQILPFIGGTRSIDRNLYTQRAMKDYYYLSEYKDIKCGNVYAKNFNVYLTDEQIKQMEKDWVKVKITVSAIGLISSPPDEWGISCTIDSLEILD